MHEQPPQPRPFRPTFGHIVATGAIFVAAIAVIALFMIPVQNFWFWPTAGVFGAAAALALLVPLRPRGASPQDPRP